MIKTYRNYVALAILLTFHPLSGQASQTESLPEKPNVIFIMCDDMGYGQLGSYGQKMIKTPRIDQMAQEGLRLTDYYAGTTVCAPSRCSLMTGRHVGHTYIRGNYEIMKTEENESGQLPIPDETITVAGLITLLVNHLKGVDILGEALPAWRCPGLSGTIYLRNHTLQRKKGGVSNSGSPPKKS